MKVLILSQFFDPEPTLKGMAFARELQRLGCEVTVLTGFPNYPGGVVYPGYRIRPWQREQMEGIDIVRVALYPSHDGSSIRRAANYATFALSAAILGPFLVGSPDVIYVYHPPLTVAIPAMMLRLTTGASFVYEIQDIWPDSLVATAMVRPGALIRLVDAACRFVYRSADRIVVISEGFRRLLIERGVPSDKIDVVLNWCDELRMSAASTSARPAVTAGGPFTVMFAGTMGAAQQIDRVLDAAEQALTAEPRARFVFVGGGVEQPRLAASAVARGLTNVSFLGRRPMEDMAAILASADALLVHLRDDPLFTITIPSKAQAYLHAGVPVIMAVRGDAAALIEKSGGGICCEPGNPGSLVNAIGTLARMSADERSAMGRRGRQFYERELSLRAGTERYMEILRAVHDG